MDFAIDAIGVRHSRARPPFRIVSLVPSLTELLFTLGLGASLVGRTGFCVQPFPQVRRVTKVGGTKDVDLEKVRSLAPTHVVVNVDETRRETYLALCEFVPHVLVTHPLVPDDNVALYQLFGVVFSRLEEAARLKHEYRLAKRQLEASVEHARKEQVIYLIWKDPWFVVSRQTYIAAMLALANWETLPAEASCRYPELSDDDAIWDAADRILLSSEPFPFRARHLQWLRQKRRVAKSISLIDGRMISWYGSRAITGMRYLAALRALPEPSTRLGRSDGRFEA